MLVGTTRTYLLLYEHINARFFLLDLVLGCYEENPITEVVFAQPEADNASKQATKCLHVQGHRNLHWNKQISNARSANVPASDTPRRAAPGISAPQFVTWDTVPEVSSNAKGQHTTHRAPERGVGAAHGCTKPRPRQSKAMWKPTAPGKGRRVRSRSPQPDARARCSGSLTRSNVCHEIT